VEVIPSMPGELLGVVSDCEELVGVKLILYPN